MRCDYERIQASSSFERFRAATTVIRIVSSVVVTVEAHLPLGFHRALKPSETELYEAYEYACRMYSKILEQECIQDRERHREQERIRQEIRIGFEGCGYKMVIGICVCSYDHWLL